MRGIDHDFESPLECMSGVTDLGVALRRVLGNVPTRWL
jgi:hypothetical protein